MSLTKRLCALLAAALLVAPAAALADPAYSVKYLPDGFAASALGSNGLVVGTLYENNSAAGATYANGTLTSYGNLGVNNIRAVSSNGMFTGRLHAPDVPLDHAFIFRDGVLQVIGNNAGLDAFGVAVNNAGQVVVAMRNGPYGETYLYSDGKMIDMGLGISYSQASAINDAGVVVGGLSTFQSVHDAFMYSNGVLTDLGAPAGGGSFATGINNNGDIVGSVWADQNAIVEHAFVYTGGQMHDLGTFGGLKASATDINDNGLIVGYVETAGSGHAFLYNNGQAWDLNALVTGADGYAIKRAYDINAQGQILANACNAAGLCRDVVLDPVSAVPEPAGFAMLLAGLVVLAGRRRTGLRAGARAA